MIEYRPGQRLYIPGVQVLQPRAYAAPSASWIFNGSALASSLVAYWQLSESSGSRADSVGSNTLTNNNSVNSTTGLVYPQAASFISANSQNLSIADNPALSMGDIDYWMAAWIYPTSLTGSPSIISKYDSVATAREWYLGRTSGNVNFTIYNASGAAIGFRSVATSANAWHFVVAYHDAANNLIGLSHDGGAFTTVAATGAPADTTAPLRIGAYQVTPIGFWDGRIGPVMMGKNYIPSSGDVAFLYNSGAGQP